MNYENYKILGNSRSNKEKSFRKQVKAETCTKNINTSGWWIQPGLWPLVRGNTNPTCGLASESQVWGETSCTREQQVCWRGWRGATGKEEALEDQGPPSRRTTRRWEFLRNSACPPLRESADRRFPGRPLQTRGRVGHAWQCATVEWNPVPPSPRGNSPVWGLSFPQGENG